MHLPLQWHSEKRSVITVEPSVIRACERLGVSRVGSAHLAATMRAHVEQNVNGGVAVPANDYRVDPDLALNKVARTRDLALMGDEDPILNPHRPHLEFPDLRVHQSARGHPVCVDVDEVREGGTVRESRAPRGSTKVRPCHIALAPELAVGRYDIARCFGGQGSGAAASSSTTDTTPTRSELLNRIPGCPS